MTTSTVVTTTHDLAGRYLGPVTLTCPKCSGRVNAKAYANSETFSTPGQVDAQVTVHPADHLCGAIGPNDVPR